MSDSLKHSCEKHLSYNPPVKVADVLCGLAEHAGETIVGSLEGDQFSSELTEKVRSLLGQEAALCMPSGKTAQNIAFKVWCERRGHSTIALHPRSHVEQWEGKAYAHVFGLNAVAFGDYDRQTVLADIDALPANLGVASVELALRPLGCPVIPWADLVAMSEHLRERGIPIHGDCARIWEAQPYLDRPLAEIAKLFDSTYVSLYKGIGRLAGAVLLGPADLIAEARIWQQRLGQKLAGEFPYHLAALKGLEERLPMIPTFCSKASSLAQAISQVDGVRVSPDPPHTNAFQVILDGRPENMQAARDEVARRMGLWLYERAPANPIDGLVTFEVHVQTAGLMVQESEVKEAISIFKSLVC